MNLLDALSGIGTVLDTPGAMLRTGLAGENPFAAVFDTDKRVSGRDLLERYGLADENEDQGWIPDMGDIGGFAAEMLLDPTNLIGGGLLKRLIGSAGKAKTANRGIEAANALSQQQRAMGFMPEEVAKLTKIVDEFGNPKEMYHGTPHVFDKYDLDKLDPYALYGKGVYTTQSPVVAGEYSHKGASELKRAATSADPRLADLKHRKEVVKSYNRKNRDVSENLLGENFDESVRLEKRWEKSWDVSDRIDEMIEARLEEVSSNAATPNVRQHFIDARNPLNIDEVVTTVTPPLEKKLIQRNRDNIRASISDAKYARNRINRIEKALDDDSVTRQIQKQTSERYFQDAINQLRGQLPFRNKVNLSPQMTGNDVYHLLGNDGVREAGYDAINHIGGGNTGGAAHNVVISLDPKNVYLPYIAKELQELQQTASPSSLLASLAGYNALTRPKYGGGAE